MEEIFMLDSSRGEVVRDQVGLVWIGYLLFIGSLIGLDRREIGFGFFDEFEG